MSKNPNEINDNEIRIISATEPEIRKERHRSVRKYILIIATILVLIAIGIILFVSRLTNEDEIEPTIMMSADFFDESFETDAFIDEPSPICAEDPVTTTTKGFSVVIDTIVNDKGLLILSPENARPRLIIGTELLNDSNIVLATQAADVRGDNGQIAGTFVLNGELISKGEAKAGYCSIINGEISIGIADATPMLEQTLTDGGYFFRQYPLVVGGQLVENKPKGESIRKALAEINGKIYVIMSKERLTFYDFSQLLIDAGVRNAIYLVGSTSYGFYVTEGGEKNLTGKYPSEDIENVNYIVWEQV